jgi:hypothetical protein
MVVMMTGRPGFSAEKRQRFLPISLCVQTDSEAYPASCPMGTGGPVGRDADHLPPSAEVKNE